jgi:hypothetical protein
MGAEQLLPRLSDEVESSVSQDQEISIPSFFIYGSVVALGGINIIRTRKPNRRPPGRSDYNPVEPILRPIIDLDYIPKGRRRYKH